MPRATLRMAWILLAALALPQSARAQFAGPCGGFVTHLWVPQPVGYGGHVGHIGTIGGGGNSGSGTHGASPVGGGSSGGGNSGGGGNGGDGVALLVLAVVAAAAFPVVLYAVDEDAQPDVMHCWWAPEERISLYSGGAAASGLGVSALLGVKGTLRWGLLGVDAAAEGSATHGGTAHGALLLRIPPKQHVEFSLGLGGRRLVSPLGSQSWFEISLPQRYAPFRWSALEPGLSFELRPAALLAPGVVDVRLDAAVVFPLGPWASFDLGVRAFTFQRAVQGGAVAGFQLSL